MGSNSKNQFLKSYFCEVKIMEKYMHRCIEIARNGLGTAAPNPAVGAILVHEGKIIGEGYTSAYGGPHAEVNAIASVKDKSLLPAATLYVTLEPCSHHGKTPPCVNLILKHNIPKIVVGLSDPNPLVAGKGIEKLKHAGCEVVLNVLENECREHHKRFLTFQEQKRPYIILKWAETRDGFIAPCKEKRNTDPEPFWITNSNSRQLTHQWRAEEQAVLVGTTTVLDDNPKLDVRNWTGKNPLRVVLDRSLKTPRNYNLLDGKIQTLFFTEIADKTQHIENVDYEVIEFSHNLMKQIVSLLHKRKITSLLVEGGAQTLQHFIDNNLWDEARVFKGKTRFHKGIAAPWFTGTLKNQVNIKNDILTTYTND